MKKIIAIGLDAATPSLISKWLPELPHLHMIGTKGIFATLESKITNHTCPAWPCFATGKNPGKLGIFEFTDPTKDGYFKIVDTGSLRHKTFWQIASEHGLRVGIFNFPFFYPPQPLNGFMVSGLLTPFGRRDYTYPPRLVSELDKVVGKYEITPMVVSPSQAGEEEYLKYVWKVHEKQTKAAVHLFKRYDPDIFVAVFHILDLVQHFFLHYLDERHPKYNEELAIRYAGVIKEAYIRVDYTVGQILALAPSDTYVLIMSDHGAIPGYGIFHINKWLKEKGYLSFKTDFKYRKPLIPKLAQFTLSHIDRGLLSHLVKIVPRRLQKSARCFGVEERDINYLLKHVDWTKTKAFGVGGGSGRIYIPIKGRFTIGNVTPEDYEQIRESILRNIRAIVTSGSGHPIKVQAYTKEEVYEGEFMDFAPDIIVEIMGADYKYDIATNMSETLWGHGNDVAGFHDRLAVLMISGPDIINSVKFKAKITDIAPTILYMLDIPIPRDMDGRVLTDIFSSRRKPAYGQPSKLKKYKRKRSASLTQSEREDIENRLKALGYLG